MMTTNALKVGSLFSGIGSFDLAFEQAGFSTMGYREGDGMNEERSFHLGDILTVTTGRIVTPGGVGAIYRILNYLTGDNLMTHQLPRAMETCKPHILSQHPALVEIDEPAELQDAGPIMVRVWLQDKVRKYGEYLSLEPLPLKDRVIRDPLEELHEMMPDTPVIVIET